VGMRCGEVPRHIGAIQAKTVALLVAWTGLRRESTPLGTLRAIKRDSGLQTFCGRAALLP